MIKQILSILHKPRKRAYLKSFGGLDIRKANTVRVPGLYAGKITSQFYHHKPEHGFNDLRDYRSKLVNVGLANVIVENNPEIGYDFEKIYFCQEMTGVRNKVVKINLAEVDLVELNEISVLLGRRIDLYDLISLLMIIGQNHLNGGVRYVRNERQKIYS